MYYLELLKARDAIFNIVAEHLVPKDIYKSDGIFYLYDYCESVYEKAFAALGFEEDLVSIEDFCRAYYDNVNTISIIKGVSGDGYDGVRSKNRSRLLTETMYEMLTESAQRYKRELEDNKSEADPEAEWLINNNVCRMESITFSCSKCRRQITIPRAKMDSVYVWYPYCHCGCRMKKHIDL